MMSKANARTGMTETRRAGTHQVSLARALSKLGAASRSQARELIEAGRVAVNRRTVRMPDLWIDLRVDRIELDGRPVTKQGFVYIAMNKPSGILTTRSDEKGRKTVYDLLSAGFPSVFPAGRLDKDTSGLLLFTNDTRFGELVTNPCTKLPKTYDVVLNKPLSESDRQMMERGMVLKDGAHLLPAKVIIESKTPARCTMTIQEGKNRQIRRMCEQLGYAVVNLKRLSVGPVRLGDLREGKTRLLTVIELGKIASHNTSRRVMKNQPCP